MDTNNGYVHLEPEKKTKNEFRHELLSKLKELKGGQHLSR